MSCIKCFAVISAFLVLNAECAKILGVMHTPGKSHYMAGSTLMKILAKNGHDVTILGSYDEKNPPANYTSIKLTGLVEKMLSQKVDYFSSAMDNPLISLLVFGALAGGIANDTMTHPVFQKFLIDNRNTKYDLIIVSYFLSESLSFLSWYFNAPIIFYCPMDSSYITHYWTGHPVPTSYVPNFYLPYPKQMTFVQRTKNFLMTTLSHLHYHYVALPTQNKILKESFPEAPSVEELVPKASLYFLNSDDGIRHAAPKLPNVIDIGGFHVKAPETLPKDLQDLLDNHPHGIIYFSMGSNLRSAEMPERVRTLLLKAFSRLKQIVLWKWENDNLPGKPENVIIRKWFPQTGILAHKNVKLFITHGGIFSSIETIFYGKPILALPVLVDQIMNAKRAESNGYAKVIQFTDITEDNFAPAIQEMLKPKYGEMARLRQIIMTDTINKAEEKVVFYTNYVIRHKGAQHLQVEGAKLPWYKLYAVDVVLFLSAITIGLAILSLKVLIYTIRRIKSVFVKQKTE